MSTRNIKIYTTLGSPGTVATDATTLADLKPILKNRGIDISGMKLLIGETKNELSEDLAQLPEGDFRLYLVPAKTKSGREDILEFVEQLQSEIDKLRALLNELKTSEPSLKSSSLTEDEMKAASEIFDILNSRTSEEENCVEDDDEWDNN